MGFFQVKFTKKQSCKMMLYFILGDETFTVDRETPFLGLPAFLSASSDF